MGTVIMVLVGLVVFFVADRQSNFFKRNGKSTSTLRGINKLLCETTVKIVLFPSETGPLLKGSHFLPFGSKLFPFKLHHFSKGPVV